jgi:hypothetical protein
MADDLITMGGGTPKQHPAEGEKGEETRKMMGLSTNHHAGSSQEEQDGYDMVPNPDADVVDLSELRGTRAPGAAADRHAKEQTEDNDDDLEALAELVPELRARKNGSPTDGRTMTMDEHAVVSEEEDLKMPATKTLSVGGGSDGEGVEVKVEEPTPHEKEESSPNKKMLPSQYLLPTPKDKNKEGHATRIEQVDSMMVQQSGDGDTTTGDDEQPEEMNDIGAAAAACKSDGDSLPSTNDESKPPKSSKVFNDDQNLGGFDDVNSDEALNSDDGNPLGDNIKGVHADKAPEKYPGISSSASLSTATQTHEVRMPMYLPTFKPATGCTNASDFIVRCFVARLRSGITVVKHGRSRWCKSRLRILHIHPDGRSLSWKPAVGEPNSSKRPPKLDLSTCTEVRHAWSPDPLNPMFTGTPILRQKCEAANAHKSFALIFPKRTVDITAVTADQCKVLMEGFSALCFRLQVANLAGRGGKKGKGEQRGIDDEEVATTASVTLTNNSTQLSPSGSGVGGRRAKSKRQ